ncbi:F-box/FBD/LRR-repeat protein At4g00160 [Linum grandiflorum]
MEKQPKKPTVGPGEDRISELPDEILHHILGRLEHPGQTIVLSKEWRRVWRSYPVVDFNKRGSEHLQKFGDSTIDRFSRDNLLPMESLKLKLSRCERVSPSVVEQLIDLALERKSKEIEVLSAFSLDKSLPYRVLFNSTVESLRLSDVFFALDKYVNIPLSRTRLRSLYLSRVQFKDVELLKNLISNSPLLETLQLIGILGKMSKLQLSQVTNLKMLRLRGACSIQEIEIVAPRLESL